MFDYKKLDEYRDIIYENHEIVCIVFDCGRELTINPIYQDYNLYWIENKEMNITCYTTYEDFKRMVFRYFEEGIVDWEQVGSYG